MKHFCWIFVFLLLSCNNSSSQGVGQAKEDQPNGKNITDPVSDGYISLADPSEQKLYSDAKNTNAVKFKDKIYF